MKHTYYKPTISSSPLSAAVKAGRTLYLSGQLGIPPETGEIVNHNAGGQTIQILENMENVLTQARYSSEDVVKTMVLMADRGDVPTIDNAYSSVWGEDKPARSVVQVVFPNPVVKVGIEAIAVKQATDQVNGGPKMKPKRIALVGCEGLGHEITAGIKAEQAGDYTLCGIYTDQPRLTAICSETLGCAAYLTSEMMFPDKPDLMIEAAGATVLEKLLEPAVKNQADVIPLSVGMFSHRAYTDHVRQIAETHGTHVYLPSGAVGGFDLMGAAVLGRELSVSIHTEKPPRALADAPCLVDRILPDRETQLVLSDNAVEAIEVFPQSIDVAIAVGLATVGVDNLFVTVAANPDLHSNRHTIDLKGEFGHARIQISAAPSSNVYSSKLAAHSVISLLKRLNSWIYFM